MRLENLRARVRPYSPRVPVLELQSGVAGRLSRLLVPARMKALELTTGLLAAPRRFRGSCAQVGCFCGKKGEGS